MDDLKALAKLINDSVNKIEEVCKAVHVPLPSLKDPFPLGEDIRFNPVVASAVNDIVAATDHISAIVRSAPSTLLVKAAGVRDCEFSLEFDAYAHLPVPRLVSTEARY